MSKMPANFLKKVRDVDILEIAEKRFNLKKMGSIYQTSCIHGPDTEPSLSFFPTNSFYCFGCGAGRRPKTDGADVISFVMWVDNCSFVEAIATICNYKKWDIPKEGLSDEETSKQSALKTLIEKNRSYWQDLQSRSDFLAYLYERGLTNEDIGQWRIGSTPRSEAYLPNRLTFAIMDEGGQTTGFSYRNMTDYSNGVEDDGAKYINSHKTPVFDKGHILYGLNFIKTRIRELDYIILSEGYNDTIIGQKYGLPIVSLMGTALTPHHIELIKRYTYTVILWLDGDQPGIDATLRYAKRLRESGFRVKIINIAGRDPDEALLDLCPIEGAGKEETQDIVQAFVEDESILASQFQINKVLSTMDSAFIETKLKTIRTVRAILDDMPMDDEYQIYLKHVAKRLDVDIESLIRKE